MKTVKTEDVNRHKRHTLQTILGIGAGLMTTDAMFPNTALPSGLPPGAGLGSPNSRQDLPNRESAAPVISGVYDVRQFGAKGDGKTLDTPAINRAIDTAATAGGGCVRFPAGTYLCFSIHLKSNITLDLQPGATVLAAETSESGSGYDPAEPNPWDHYQDFGHSHWHNALIWGEGIQNLAIVGPGLIWGKGLTRGKREAEPGVGDKSISLKNCHNVTIRDISILHGGHFGILATGVDNLTIDNLKIDTNRDGIDIDCCRNVRVSNCTVNSPWDDAICPKSSYALGYARATEELTITNCFVTGDYEEGTLLNGTFRRFPSSHQAPRIGRIKFGTESNGGFKNITISNCVFDHCWGLALESVDGALLEDVTISNITMRDIYNLPIFLRLGRRMRGPKGIPVGQLCRVNISNIVASNTASRYSCIISGIPGHDIKNVRLGNITILHQGGGTRQDATIEPPEKEAAYPEPTMFGTMPAYGFYIRHVKDIEMSNIEIRTIKEDFRPPFVLDDVKGADFIHIKAQLAPSTRNFALRNVRDFNVYLSRPVPDTHLDVATQKKI